MAKGNVSFVEMHVEKLVLGLSGVILLVMAFLFLVRSPNKIEYGGGRVDAGELNEALLQDARAVQNAIKNQKPEEVQVRDYAAELKDVHARGIFAATGAGLNFPPELRLAATFGRPVPALAEQDGGAGNIALVQPLAPSQPRLATYRSLVLRKAPAPAAPTGEPSAPPPEAPSEPVELTAVTVAAYFPHKTQQEEMLKAKYDASRARVYVAGVDVQRQEMLAGGEFSEWRDVTSQVAPPLEIPAVQVDPETGVIKNDAKLRETYELVKASQQTLMQPPFYEVQGGDLWELPPLPGLEPKDEEEPEAKPSPRPKPEPRTGPRPAPAPRPTPGGARPRGPIDDVIGGGGGGGAPGGPRTAGPSQEVQARKEAKQRITQALKDARLALGRKEYDQAVQIAERVLSEEYASAADQNQAKRIVKRASRAQGTRASRATGPDAGGGLVIGDAGGGGGSIIMGDVPPRPTSGRPTPPPGGAVQPEGGLLTRPGDPGTVVVMFHDDQVEGGKTYRYRMRVKLWNRYLGQIKALQNPEQARRVVLEGEWSPPSAAITARPTTHFFVSSAGGVGAETARVDVFKWYKDTWLREPFVVGVGDVIGGPKKKVKTGEIDEEGRDKTDDVDFTTGAVVLDVRPDERVIVRTPSGKEGVIRLVERKSLVLVYLDPADGQVKQRVQEFDKYDPLYKELKEYELP